MINIFYRKKTILHRLENTQIALKDAKEKISELEADKELEKQEVKVKKAKYNIQQLRQETLTKPLTDEEKQKIIDYLVTLDWEHNSYFIFELNDDFPNSLVSVVNFINEETELYAEQVYQNSLQVSKVEKVRCHYSNYYYGGQF
ncbi:hypothetical protein B5G91_12600 [Listeria monocytogenes]|nr:hypothetical protein [Listeria monocytogenes]